MPELLTGTIIDRALERLAVMDTTPVQKNTFPYPGDTDMKRFARGLLYLKSHRMWEAGGGIPDGLAVVLAGPAAPEINGLRYLFGWPAEKVVFVDLEEKYLKEVGSWWPGVRTYHGPVHAFLKSIDEPVGFVNFDFMGSLNDTTMAAIAAVGPLLSPRAIVSYTFHRGRESKITPRWDEARAVAKLVGFGGEHPMALDAARFIGYSQLILNEIRRPCRRVLTLRYTGKHANMGMLTFQHVPFPTTRWEAALKDTVCVEETRGTLHKTDVADRLGALILSVPPKMKIDAAANLLNISKERANRLLVRYVSAA